jgi:hypothetical protein
LNTWKSHFSVINVHRFTNVRQIETHRTEPLVPEVEISIAKLKRYKSPGSDQTPAEITHAAGEILCSRFHNSIVLSGVRKNCLINGRSLLLYQFTSRAIKLTAVITGDITASVVG